MHVATCALHERGGGSIVAGATYFAGGSSGIGGGRGGRPTSSMPPPPSAPPPPSSWLGVALLTLAAWATATPWARRGVRFWLGVAPILSSYGGIMLTTVARSPELRAERLSANHERQAPRALRLVQHLAGGYVKMGQVLSNRADVLPEPFVRAFGTLQDDMPPRAWASLAASLPKDAPSLLEELEWVDEEALGAASTGQVHRARLRDGSDVVLKLQYREARAFFGHDLGNVARLARLALPAMCPVVKEVRRRFQGEFDYAREARDMLEVQRRNADGRIVVPTPRLELTTTRVLVMEYLAGDKLLSSIRARFIEAVGEGGYTHAKAAAMGVPPPSGSAAPSRARQLRAAPSLWLLRRQTRLRLRLLLRTLGTQIFEHGLFHADPHPGNVLLLADGRLGLIDYGQTVRLSPEQRLRLARLMLALADAPPAALALTGSVTADADAADIAVQAAQRRVAAAATDLGFVTRRNSDAGLAATASFFFDRDPPPDTRSGKRRSPAQTLKALDRFDKLVTIPSEFILAARVSLLMRGSSQLMAQQSVSTATAWRAQAQRVVDELG